MKVLIANPRGFCAGVDRAIRIVDLALEVHGAPVYVRKEIVHNSYVVRELRGKGVVFVNEVDEVPEGAVAVLSAHGVSPAVVAAAQARNLVLIDATCPLVTKVHQEVHRYGDRGYHIVLIGHEGHDEVVGTLGESPDNISLVETEAEVEKLDLPEDAKLMVLTQTTLGVDDTKSVMAALKARYPHVETPATDDICYATQNRQDAVKEMCRRGIERLLVVGSRNSSNAARLVEVGLRRDVQGYLIDDAAEINPAWLRGVSLVGVTAGASTPESVVQKVLDRLRELGAASIEPCTTAKEHLVFQLPPLLKRSAHSHESKSVSCGEEQS